LPHPSENRQAVANEKIRKILSSDQIALMIAEDVVANLTSLGHQVIVFGFGSTALLTLAKFARVVNLIFKDQPDIISSGFRTAARIRQIRCR
jgi:hypothetical protein